MKYKTRVAQRNLDFTPEIWQEFLGCRPSTNSLEFYPSLIAPLPSPFESITLDSIHEHFFHKPRPLGVNLFQANELSAIDNVLYKVIVHCLLPIVTRGLALVRPPHFFLMYAFRHLLDVNVSLSTFHCITHFIKPNSGKVHMPFGQVITMWLDTIGIDVSKGVIKPMSKKYDRINARTCSLAGMIPVGFTMGWVDGRQVGDAARDVDEEAEAAEAAPEPDSDIMTRLSEFEESVDTRLEELSLENQSILTAQREFQTQVFSRIDTLEQRQLEMLEILRSLAPGQPHRPIPSSTGAGDGDSHTMELEDVDEGA